VTTGAIRRAKLQSNCHYQQTHKFQLFTGRMPFLSPNQVPVRLHNCDSKIYFDDLRGNAF